MKKKILMGYDFDREAFKELEKDFDLTYPDKQHFTREDVIKLIPEYDVLVPNFSFKTDDEVMKAGKKLKLVANYGVGYDNIDVPAATANNVVVTNTPQAVLEPTAEFCFALLLATARRIGFYNNKLRSEQERIGWGIFDNLGASVYGKTLGIYGMGRIGQAVARRAVASGIKVIYHNRKPLPSGIEAKYGARYVDFDTLLKEADFISLNAPASAETYHLMGMDEFRKMKPSAILINTARGSLVDEKALAQALKEKEIFAAGLDVFEREPKITPELLDFDNVIVAPHAGTATYAARYDMQKEVVKNILNFFDNKPIERVN